MALCAAGSEQAFAALVRRHGLSVFRYFLTVCGEPDRANDLVQETFLRVFRHRERFRPEGVFRNWLFAIAGNLARSDRRARKRRPIAHVAPPDRADPTPGPAERADAAERCRRIAAAMDELPQAQREALRMRLLEGRSFDEIGRRLGCPTGTARSRVFYGLAALRARLGGEAEEVKG